MFHNKLITLAVLSTACLLTAAQMSVNLSGAVPPSTVVPILPIKEDTTTTTSTTTTTTTTTTAVPTTTTTTAKTTTTTPTTTTTEKTTTTTTVAPTTTTAAPITTTTPSPKPYPEPEIGTWNSSCVMVRMAAQLNFTYDTKDNKTAQALYNIPKDSKVEDMSCDMNSTQFLQVNWGPITAQHTMVLQFDRYNGTTNMTMMMFTLPLMGDNFPNAKENQTIQLIYRGGIFTAPSKMSYHCTRPQVFNLTETIMNKEVLGTIKVHDVQTEAFRTSNDTGFSTARDCDSSETPDVVPIAVGIALVALIIIVLVSYLCARHRSTSRGYMSF
ncbi:lysosome-associated membrane glycoprotein 1 [Lucilia cuprina]|uniref:lysosome-associated membrane glycoprotein 1 n=1 Tax=Lucilia cuprina TaxID=7375 RepID=UPI001F05A77F|nr:lysosome-associated membrane glycoprotein 1 [Lucilia cuprina]